MLSINFFIRQKIVKDQTSLIYFSDHKYKKQILMLTHKCSLLITTFKTKIKKGSKHKSPKQYANIIISTKAHVFSRHDFKPKNLNIGKIKTNFVTFVTKLTFVRKIIMWTISFKNLKKLSEENTNRIRKSTKKVTISSSVPHFITKTDYSEAVYPNFIYYIEWPL